MEYVALSGHMEEGEAWSPGPLHGTVWVLRHPDRHPVVVHVTKGTEVEYEIPAPPAKRYPKEVLEKADDIRRRYLAHDPALRRYRKATGPRPSKAEVDAAQHIVDHEKAQDEAEALFRAHHTASTPVAVTRLLALAGIELPKKTRTRRGQTDE
ncbi:hypothetical protein [Rhodococcus phage REQ1]|uniref:hypothetical protein n=1 Tax=Rhodococcus phage REQ1 TaxID=1109712 RepID=UPI00023EEBE9|nr:hypothetical protein RoPhREQ1_gp08 [Rhodococcus phage REQ1]AEV52004.1 hypothetical protein [Rhodococcus phage REQ1]